MTKKSYAMNVYTILGVSVALMLFIFALVVHHKGISDRVRLDRSALLAVGSSAAERIKPVGQISVAPPEPQREPAKKVMATKPASRDGQQVYQATCVVCHGAGIAGAPK